MKKAWKRILSITFTSTEFHKQIVFGNNHLENKPDLEIEVEVSKYMSLLKDTASIKITNLTYSEIIKIINGKYFDVDIVCGYQYGNVNKIFSGGVISISNSLNSRNENTVIILCASKLIAKYCQSRLKFGMNSGINMYSAMKFICERAGIKNANISSQLMKNVLSDTISKDGNTANWLNSFSEENSTLIMNSDNIYDSVVNVFDAARSNNRVIPLDSKNIIFTGGYPQLTNDGIRFTVLPTFSFMAGDVVKVDNSIIQIPVSSQSDITKNYGYYLDEDGNYMVMELHYRLANRSANFSLELHCKSRSLISNLVAT